jgi:UDP-N-acetylglucosamine 4-epimerase
MSTYEAVKGQLISSPVKWLVTGAAGFIGSGLVEALLRLGQQVVGLDNFSTGKWSNLEDLRENVTDRVWQNFKMVEGDIRNLETCEQVCANADFVLHQAALGSVPRSLRKPVETNDNNVTGFVNMLAAAKDARVRRFVFASSSSIYGDDPRLPKIENEIGNCLSPYAVSKRVNELYADVFARCYGLDYIALRYFNVFGPRQDPEGAYAAVIPKWIAAMIDNQQVTIYGDGETSRDFCYIDNVVQANLRAATVEGNAAVNRAYNIAVGERTTLNELFEILRSRLVSSFSHLSEARPTYLDFRRGDVRHSQADISLARALLGFQPSHRLEHGLDEALHWYVRDAQGKSATV